MKNILIFSIFTILMLSSVSMALPNVYADNFQISQECDDGITTVYTSFGGEPLPNVSVFIYTNNAMKYYEGKVITDENGKAEIQLTEKTNFAKFSKGGYNDTSEELVKCEAIPIEPEPIHEPEPVVYPAIERVSTWLYSTFEIPYTTLGSELVVIKFEDEILWLSIDQKSSGYIELRIPREFYNAFSSCIDAPFDVYNGWKKERESESRSITGQKINYEDKSNDSYRILKIPLGSIGSPKTLAIVGTHSFPENAVMLSECEQKPQSNTNSPSSIPEWIKNTAGWWADGQIGDEDFLKGIEFLLNENIIKLTSIPDQQSGDTNQKVPDWVKNNAKWWADGQIDDGTFVQGIQFLIENGIIAYSPQTEPAETKTEPISLLPTKDDLNFKSYHSWNEGCDDVGEISEKIKVCEQLSFAVEDKPPIYIINVWKFPNSIDSNQFFQTKSDAAMIIAKGVGGDFEVKNLEPMTQCYEWDIQLMGGASCVLDSYIILLTFAEKDSFGISTKLMDSSLSKIFKTLQIENYQTLSDHSKPLQEVIPPPKTDEPSDSSLPFDMKVINCSLYGTDSVKVEYYVTSNWDKTVDLELVIKGVDINDKVLSISTPGMYDLVPGQTRYDETFIDNHPNLDSCAMGLNDISETTPPSYTYAPVDFEVISCSPYGTDSVKVEYSVTSHYDTIVDLELVIKGVNSNGEVLSISTPRAYDLLPEQTKYDKTYIDDISGLSSCEIGINQILD